MIEFQKVSKTFMVNQEEIKGLENISFQIPKGSLVVLKGSSGSGKSTVLSLLAALSRPTSGEVIVMDKKISKLHDNFSSIFRRENIGFIFQKYNLIPNLSVEQNILVPLIPNNPDLKKFDQKINELLNLFGIENKKNVQVQNLSGGEQQRVAIARSLINDPQIIIADEPTANLDERLSLEFIEILKELKSQDRTIIVATHDPLFFDLDVVDRTIELKNGRLI
jgi:putative ABC transport system ATP-binding protein